MRVPPPSRRAALLGATGLLSGCGIGDAIEGIIGERKRPLPGERRPVLTAAERPLGLEEGGARAVSLPPVQARDAWPQAGGDPRHAPGHPGLPGTPGARLAELWRASVGRGSAYRRRLVGPPVVADGAVYAADAYGEVAAMDAATGGRRWSLDTRPRNDRDGALGAGVALEGGSLYVATGLAEALALNPADGTVRWRVSLPAPARGAPTVAGGRLYVPTTENHLVALSTTDGERGWTYRAQSVTTMALGLPAPAVEGDIVVAGFGSGEVVAIRTTDGRAIWSETLTSARGGGLADIAAVTAMPVIERNRVIAAGLGGIVIALDIRSGRRLWEREATTGETPWVAGDAVYLVTTGGDLACLGFDDGRVRWLHPLGRFADERRRRDPITWGPPVVAGGRVLVAGSTGKLVQLNPANGEPLGEQVLSFGGATLQPAVAGGTLYVLGDDGTLAALRGAG